jgi:hypothetical protein
MFLVVMMIVGCMYILSVFHIAAKNRPASCTSRIAKASTKSDPNDAVMGML